MRSLSRDPLTNERPVVRTGYQNNEWSVDLVIECWVTNTQLVVIVCHCFCTVSFFLVSICRKFLLTVVCKEHVFDNKHV